jgi:hypothetical protein
MHLNEDDLVLHYYGETPETDDGRVSAHLAACAACQQAYRQLQQVMAVVDQAGQAAFEPVEGYERTAWARLQPALEPERRGWLSWLLLSPPRLAWVGLVVVLVAGAYFAGRLTSPPAEGPRQASAEALREGVLLVNLSDHFERSQMVLIELVSSDAATDGHVDISSERDRARDLVASGRLYRQTAAGTGDTALLDLLDQLERVLVDVATSPSEVSEADLNAVRQRIDNEGLLFKVRVVSTDLRDRQRQAPRPTSPTL